MQLSSRPSCSSPPVARRAAAARSAAKRVLSPRIADPHPASNKRPRVSRANTPTSAISFVSQSCSNRSETPPQFSPSPSPRVYVQHSQMRTHVHSAVPPHSPHFSPQPLKPYLDAAVLCDPSLPASPYYSPRSFSPTPVPSDEQLGAAVQQTCVSRSASAKRFPHHDEQQSPSPQLLPPPLPPHHLSHQWNEADLVSAICDHLQALCDVNNHQPAACSSNKYHAFFSQYRQPFALSFYITRLIQFCNCSLSAFILALIFVQRVQHKCAQLAVNDMNVHRLFCTALVLAIKNVDDELFSNGYYARVGGITLRELNELETLMLDLLDWNVCCSVERFDSFEKCLLHRLALLVVHSENDDQPSPQRERQRQHERDAAVTSAA